MLVALDTNFLAYAEGINDTSRRDQALDLLQLLPAATVQIPAQVLGELFNVLTRKARLSHSESRARLMTWRDTYEVCDTTAATIFAAVDLAATHQLTIWDAVILTAASHSGCRLLLSEDLQDRFTWGGVTVLNPFDSGNSAWLNSLFSQQ